MLFQCAAIAAVALEAPRILLPLSTGAACLDGSPYAFYFTPNRSSTRWGIEFRGGGWCYNESLCAARAQSKLGTSTLQPATGECVCPFYDASGAPDGASCNCVSLVYCDGASFSGYRAAPWPVAGPGRARESRKGTSAYLYLFGAVIGVLMT